MFNVMYLLRKISGKFQDYMMIGAAVADGVKPVSCYQKATGSIASDVLVGTLHDSHRHQPM